MKHREIVQDNGERLDRVIYSLQTHKSNEEIELITNYAMPMKSIVVESMPQTLQIRKYFTCMKK